MTALKPLETSAGKTRVSLVGRNLFYLVQHYCAGTKFRETPRMELYGTMDGIMDTVWVMLSIIEFYPKSLCPWVLECHFFFFTTSSQSCSNIFLALKSWINPCPSPECTQLLWLFETKGELPALIPRPALGALQREHILVMELTHLTCKMKQN